MCVCVWKVSKGNAAGRIDLLQRPGAGQHLHGVVDAPVLEDDGEVLHEQVQRAHPCGAGER